MNPVVKVLGKNLLDTSKATLEYGKTKIINGEIYLNGTYDSSYDYYLFGSNNETLNIIKKINKTVSISCGSFIVGIWKRPGIVISGKVIKINPFAENLISIYVTIPSGTYDNIKLPIIVEIGEVATEYEQYQEQIATLPYTINAIPVSSGGNVTIDGQEYIADYVDMDKKQFVQNVLKWKLSERSGFRNGEVFHYNIGFLGITGKPLSISSHWKVQTTNYRHDHNSFHISSDGTVCSLCLENMSNMTDDEIKEWVKTNDPIFISVLLEPKIIDLTDEEVQAFKDLASYYPTTNVFVTSEQLEGYTEFNYPLNMKNGWDYVMEQIGETREFRYDTEVNVLENKIDTAILTAMMEG